MNIAIKTLVDSGTVLPKRTFLGISLGALASLILSACSSPQFSRENESELTTNEETKNLKNNDAIIIGLNIALYCNSVTNEDEKSGTKSFTLTQKGVPTNLSFKITYNDSKELEQIVLYDTSGKENSKKELLTMKKLYGNKNETFFLIILNKNNKKFNSEVKVSTNTFKLDLDIDSQKYSFLHDGTVILNNGKNNSFKLFSIIGDKVVYNKENIYGGFEYGFSEIDYKK